MPSDFHARLQSLIQATSYALPPKLYGLREKELRTPSGPLGPIHALGLRWPTLLILEAEDFKAGPGQAPSSAEERRADLQQSYEHLLAQCRFIGANANFPYSSGLPPLPRKIIAALVVSEKVPGLSFPSFEEGPLRFAGLFDEHGFEAWLGVLSR